MPHKTIPKHNSRSLTHHVTQKFTPCHDTLTFYSTASPKTQQKKLFHHFLKRSWLSTLPKQKVNSHSHTIKTSLDPRLRSYHYFPPHIQKFLSVCPKTSCSQWKLKKSSFAKQLNHCLEEKLVNQSINK